MVLHSRARILKVHINEYSRMAVCSARAHAPCLLVLTLLSQLLAIHGQSGYPLEVIELSDSDFEARTQAATGQTTGHWCVSWLH